MYQHIKDIEYRENLISLYRHEETSFIQLMVRKNDGYDYLIGDWKDPLFIKNDISNSFVAKEIGMAFIDGYLSGLKKDE